MQRLEDLRTPVGHGAWLFYQDWMKLQKRRVPDDRAFIRSRYYNAFVRFATHVRKIRLPLPEEFIKFAIGKQYLPPYWTYNEVYVQYMEHLNTNLSVEKHVELTFDTINKLCQLFECEPGEIFDNIEPSEMVALIRERKLSPWILLVSPKFLKYLERIQKTHPEQHGLIGTIIRATYWANRFREQPESHESMRKLVNKTKM